EARKDLLTSFLVFMLAIAIGMVSSAADPDFLQVILGEDYVEMTKENIKSGDPMGVYKQKGEFNAFLGITLNNVRVAFFTFILGVFYAIGTIGILLYNGVMLGAFQFFFIQEGLFRESFLAVWLHGTLEISSCVIAGAAGLTMGKGLVFPGTLSRMRSFQLAARRGVSILMGTLPLFVFAGFIESYLTRHTDAPDALRAGFIFACLAFVLFYFVFYPRWKAKKATGISRFDETRLTPDTDRSIYFSVVKTVGDVFTDAFIFCRLHFKAVGWAAAAGALIYCLGAFLLAETPARRLFFFEEGFMGMGIFTSLPQLFSNENHPWLFPLTTIALSLVVFIVQRRLAETATSSDELLTETTSDSPLAQPLDFLKTLAVVSLLNLVILTLDWYTILLIWLTFPLLLTW
ncbi:MAG: stage II sporulation protein M, partial [Bacteroidota bacterium]